MRLMEFWRLMEEEFGRGRARMVADHQALSELGSMTASEALAAGVAPRQIWEAVCVAMAVPPERQWGRDRPVRRGPID
ncbi:hypothetical protein KEM60_02701 [Austwickia sp. TVS 96-490-7B]|nr:DUF3046 domain-containing protein [Austwickia sp. TVS 96-490-7B]MBW3086480.1 hypothetical protein [Austwickia sp. TVS 96-490-7B]